MSFELFIGGRYLRTRQKQAFISLITILSIAGVTVGVMALIIVIAVMTGFEEDLKSRILGVESHVVIMRQGGNFADYPRVLEYVQQTEGVEAATPFIYTQIMLRSSGGLSGAVLRGITPGSAEKVVKNLDASSLAKPEPDLRGFQNLEGLTPGIILGKELASNLGVQKGDAIYLISPRGMISPMGHLPAMKRFEVTELFESGMYEYDSSLAYVHMEDAQKLLRMGDTVTGIEVRITHIYKAQEIAKKISKDLGWRYSTRDWMQMNQNFFSALKLEKTVMFIILALIVLVAAFNIASSLIMMVMEKTKDIAILKAMGATDRNIRRIFTFKGMTIGFIGTFLGVSLGSLLCVLLKHYKFIELPGNVYYITTLPVQLEYMDVFIISAAAMVICFLATLYPARQASKLNPVEALRY
jgi:lipoprotein-releasing system permease protein